MQVSFWGLLRKRDLLRSGRVVAEPRARGVFAVALLGGLLAALSCGPDPEIEGQSKQPMARQAVEQYLGSLNRGDFATAARYFAGPFEVLRGETGLETEEAAGLLEAYSRLPGVYRHEFKVIRVRLMQPHTFSVEVEFKRQGWPDTISEFRVTYDGMKYVVLGIPPKTGEPVMDPPASN